MLSADQFNDFHDWGYCRLPSAFDPELARELGSRLLQFLDRELSVRLDDPSTWRDLRGGAHFTRLVRTGVFKPVATARLAEAIDDLLGPGNWADPRGWGSPLVTLPANANSDAAWDVPSSGWHTDFPCWPPAPTLRMFAYLSDVQPEGAGTLVVAGSHRMAASWAERNPEASRNSGDFKKSLGRCNPWFAELFSREPSPQSRTARFMDETTEAFGVSVRVVELSANAGDVVLWHPSLLHAEAPNALRDPRLMATHTVQASWPKTAVSEPRPRIDTV
ncbi:MAG TPA: phytanoyl-CoA dioxygenase family protein [Mycobacteriales bacterium]|nr:phytanoyl-CoA dioxygenase family protein [Mycobacteriales bacterium]